MTCSILLSKHTRPISITNNICYYLFIIYTFVMPFSASKFAASLSKKNFLQKLLILWMSSTNTSFLKNIRIIMIPLKTKTAMPQKFAPQKPIYSWEIVKCPSRWYFFNTSTLLFSSIKKSVSDKTASVLLFRNDLGHYYSYNSNWIIVIWFVWY